MIKAVLEFNYNDGDKVMSCLTGLKADIVKCRFKDVDLFYDLGVTGRITVKLTTYEVLCGVLNKLNLECSKPVYLLSKKEVKK